MINVSKREKFQNTCANLDLNKDGNKVWSLIDNLSGESRVKNPKPVNTLDGKIVDDKGKAHAHNKFFAMVNKSSKLNEADKELLKELHSKEKAPRANEEAFETDFTHREMKKALKKLKHRKAPGPDGLHNEMLKRLGTEGKKVLLEYINITWRKGNLPFEWKSAVVKPILKKNKPAEELSSYRPISLTSCLCKVAERMVNGRLYWWLEANKLLDPHQAGFRSKHRTDDQLFRLSQKVIDGFHKEQNTTAVFVDLKQAYDRVWRKGLLLKMQRLGIHGKMYKWIKNYLSDRIIQTRVNHETSSKQVLEEGLPQGSSLSCTLFLIFINDLPGQLKYGKLLYDEDLVLWHKHKQIGISARLLNEDLKRLEEYCKKWKLKINCNKTVYTIFTKSPKIADKTVHLEIDGMPLEKESNPVYLGVTLDRQFTLNDQMKKLSEKSTRRLKIIKRLASTIWGADKKTLRQLYIGYVRSSMEYNLPLQAISSDTTQKNLDKIESQAVHFISGGMRSAPTAACQIDADIMPLRLRREAAVVEMVERYRRTDENHPNAKIVNSWKQNDRIQQKSILKVEASLKEKYNMPENREQEIIVNKDLPPFKNLKEPTIKQETLVPISKKNSDEIEVRRAGLETIYSYQDFEVQVYTDGSATKGTSKGGYGARIEFHDGTCQTIAQPCGLYCSNFEAEAKAITSAIDKIGKYYENKTITLKVVIFTDSESVLLALENHSFEDKCIEELANKLDVFILQSFCKDIVLQWIPSHCELPGNESADNLAKMGASKNQPNLPVSQRTCKQQLKETCKKEWLRDWTQCDKGRNFYKYYPKPNSKDPINSLERRDQVTIFRLRTGHVPLNKHLNRINPEHHPACNLCLHPFETVEHFLFQCQGLQHLRDFYLPTDPDPANTLYASSEQLKRTSTFFTMANGRRAQAQVAAGSEK